MEEIPLMFENKIIYHSVEIARRRSRGLAYGIAFAHRGDALANCRESWRVGGRDLAAGRELVAGVALDCGLALGRQLDKALAGARQGRLGGSLAPVHSG